MSRPGKIPVYFVVLFAALMGVLACDTLGISEDPKVTISAELAASQKAALSGCEITFEKSADEETFQSCSAEKTYRKDENQTLRITGSADTYKKKARTVSLGSNRSVTLRLSADSVSVTIDVADATADTAVVGDIYLADTLAKENVSSATFQIRKATEPISGRVERRFFRDREFQFTPDRTQTLGVSLERKTAEVAVELETNAEEGNLSEAKIKIYEPYAADSTSCTGKQCSKNLVQRSGERKIKVTLIDSHPETGDRRRYDPFIRSFAADEDYTASPILEALPACNDGISNESGEDAKLVDENDPGCLNQDGEYEPDDDNEGHVFIRNIGISTSLPEDGVYRVISSADNQRRYGYPGGLESDRAFDLPASIVDAVIVGAGVDTERDSTQADETFAATFKCGSTRDNPTNVNTSGIVADNNEQHGWAFTEIPEIALEFFRPGRFCRIIYKHGTLVRDEPPGDGKDDVFYLKPDGENRATVISFFVEEEDYDSNKNTLARKQAGGSRCSPQYAPCTKVRINGYPR